MTPVLMAVMLIYMNGTGGPATIQFSSLAACRAAEPTIQREFPSQVLIGRIKTVCVEVPR